MDGSQLDVWGDCIFVDPVADIAVLGEVDNQVDENFSVQWDAYLQLVESVSAISIGKVETGLGWMLSLDGKCERTKLEVVRSIWGTSLLTGPVKPGMSGSPVLNLAGKAIGVATMGSGGGAGNFPQTGNGPQPTLARNLPVWLVEELQ